MKKLLSNRRLLAIVAAIVAVLLIAAVAFVLTSRANSTYALDRTPPTTQIPVFAQNADAVSGWSKLSDDGLLRDSREIPFITYQNKAKTCTLTTTTLTYPVYLKGRGDLWLSKNALYQQATQQQKLIKDESNAYISTSNGLRLQFETGQYSANGSTVHLAVRAVDKTYKKPPTALGDGDGNVFGLDPNLTVPVLVTTYSCKGTASSTAEFDTLLQALSVNLK